MAGRLVFTLQAVQKVVGSLALLLVLVYSWRRWRNRPSFWSQAQRACEAL